jgi:molecular chaperone GrpE (heat shock protein)
VQTGRLLLSLVEVLDAFERIFADVTAREEAVSGAPQVWLGNFRTVYRLLAATLREQGVVPVEVRTGLFDPVRHQAVETVPDPELPAGTILRQEVCGYGWGSRILRKPGVVVVGQAKTADPTEVQGTTGGASWAGS